MPEHLDAVAGLLAALCWAIGGLAFSRIPAGVGAINFGKNLIGSGLLAAVLLASPRGFAGIAGAGAEPLLWLAASAVIGILIGDSSSLRAMQTIGVRRAMVLSTLSPVFAAAAGWFLLAELLGAGELLGIALTLLGVTAVIRERGGEGAPAGAPAPAASRPLSGVLHGVNGALCQAVGAALTKMGMAGGLPPLEASLIRLAIAAAAGVAFALVAKRARRWLSELTAPGIPARMVLASAIGTFLGIWLSLIALDALPVAIASTQTSTTPIFGTILVALLLGEKVSARAWIGTVIAVAGVAALFLA